MCHRLLISDSLIQPSFVQSIKLISLAVLLRCVESDKAQEVQQLPIKGSASQPETCFNKFGCPYNLSQNTFRDQNQAGDPKANGQAGEGQPRSAAERGCSRRQTRFFKVKVYNGERVTFCEFCFDCYKQNQKCDYCAQVYFSVDKDSEVDGKDWISCDRCQKWNHPDCEIAHGKQEKYRAAAQESKHLAALEKEEETKIYELKERRKQGISKSTLTDEQVRKLDEEIAKHEESKRRIEAIVEAAYYCIDCRAHIDKDQSQQLSKPP